MEDQITVNGRVLSIRRLLGKGKGGYSYLAADERGEYVVKQIHHEPCEYYQFGDKLAAEQRDYERLLSAGSPCRACWTSTRKMSAFSRNTSPAPRQRS